MSDQSGGVIPQATVTLTNENTGLRLVMKTGATGYYMFPGLKAGTYRVGIEATGFEKFVQFGIPVSVQQDVVINTVLQPGSLLQTLEVRGAAPSLQTQDASVGQVVGGQEVNDLPLNGRNYTFLAQIAAGVTFGQQDSRGENASGNFAANGIRSAQNDYLLDGIDNNSNLYDFLNGTNYVVRPPIDAIQEFKIQTSNFSAELGRAGGAVLNATIKSGTNQLHGDAWEFVRNDKLDAANFFENAGGVTKGEYRQNQFGGTLGGPIVIPRIYNGKDRTFFFLDYEGTRIRQAVPYVATVPTARERNSGYTDLSDLIAGQSGTRTDHLGRTTPVGTVFDPATTRGVTAGQVDPLTGLVATATGYVREPFTGNQIPAARLDSNAIKLLNLYPVPKSPGLFGNYTTNPANRDTTDQFDVRIDHNFGAEDQMFGRISFSDEPTYFPPPFPGLADGGGFNNGNQTNVSINNVLSETHTFSPTLINEARLGYARIGSSRTQPFAADYSNIPAQYGIQGIPQTDLNGGLPTLGFSGLSGMGSGAFLPSAEYNGTLQFTENLTKIHGSHTFKGGFEYQRIRLAVLQPAWSRGRFSFDGVYTEVPNTGGGSTGLAQALLTPIPSTVAGGFDNVGGADSILGTNIYYANMGRSYYGSYFEDDWRVSHKLTVNLGLRWEWHGQYAENTGADANMVPGPPGSAQYLISDFRCKDPLSPSFQQLTQQDGIAVTCSGNTALVQVPKDDFSPRVGFAYKLTSKLVIRGAYGIFYGSYENAALGRFNSYPFSIMLGFPSPDTAHPITYSNGSIGTLETGLTGFSFDPTNMNASGLGLNGEQYNYRSPYTQSYNLSLQYQLTPNQTIQLGYVGNNVRHLQEGVGSNLNSEMLPPSLDPQDYVPYPDFGRGAGYEAEEGDSYYNALQAVFERRFSQGFNFLGNYTYSKCRSDGQDNLNTTSIMYRAPYLPNFGIQGDYGLCDFDTRQVAHFSGGYAIPFGKGKRFLRSSSGIVDGLVGGWRTNWILTLQDGQPFTIGCPIGTTAGFGCYALKVPGQNPNAGPHNVNHWLNPAAYANPLPATTVGQTDYSPLGGNPSNGIGPGFHRMDFSIFKEFRTTERTHLEFRAEFFNLTNHPNFSLPAYNDFTNPRTFGRINSTRDGQNDQREIQFALKFYF